MSNLVDQDETMLGFQLRRVPQYWGLKSGSRKKARDGFNTLSEDLEESPEGKTPPEEFVYYMLAPWWARHKSPVLYLQQFQS